MWLLDNFTSFLSHGPRADSTILPHYLTLRSICNITMALVVKQQQSLWLGAHKSNRVHQKGLIRNMGLTAKSPVYSIAF